MSDQDELRDRIEQIIEDKTYATAPDGLIAGAEDTAQAIIDEFGLEVVSDGGRPEWKLQIVGKWEESDEQESRP